jgi:hypothetical protein
MLEPFILSMVPFVLCPIFAVSAIVREKKSLAWPAVAVVILAVWLFSPGTAQMASYIAELMDRPA